MATVFDEAVIFLDQYGLTEVVLPFLFVFTIVFGLLEKTKVLGQEKDGSPKRKFNTMIAFILGFIFVSMQTYVGAFNIFLPLVAFLAIVAFLVVLFLNFLGVTPEKKAWIFVPALIVVVYISALAFGLEPGKKIAEVFATIPWMTVIIILIFIGIVWFITHEKEAPPKPAKPTPPPAQPHPQLPPEQPPPPQPTATFTPGEEEFLGKKGEEKKEL